MNVQRELTYHLLGRLPYRDAWQLQQNLVERRKQDDIGDTLLLLEHEPVVTLGRDGSRASLKLSESALAQRGIELVESDRGGDATYHGPGQVVGYLIIDLKPNQKDLRRYVRNVEDGMLRTLADYGLSGGRVDGAPGAWLLQPERKIGAIGARVSRWVTHHGFAFNVNTRLDHFDVIIPCGIADKGVTSLASELNRRFSMVEVMERLAHNVAAALDRVPRNGHSAGLLME
ncbi:MAG: lipoyl(octanoyl) transferase LipB [Bradymonadia bacterium]